MEYKYKVKKIEKQEDVKIFYLEPIDKKMEFKPGQFCSIYIPEYGKTLMRPYSIASAPEQNFLRLVIRMVNGLFTSKLDKIKEGAILGVLGPFGHFFYNNEKKVVMFAAGTGIAPMIGILEHIKIREIPANITIFFSNRKHIPCKKFLDLFNTIYTITEDPNWNGEKGRFDLEKVKKYKEDFSGCSVFICGPTGFAKAMKEISIKLGAREEDIHVEAWG